MRRVASPARVHNCVHNQVVDASTTASGGAARWTQLATHSTRPSQGSSRLLHCSCKQERPSNSTISSIKASEDTANEAGSPQHASQGRRGAAREPAAARRVPPGGAGAGRLARRQRARQCSAPRRGGPVACGKASSRSRQQRQQRQQRRWRRDESGDFLAPRSLSARSTQHPHRLSHDSERHAFIIVCSFACPDLPNDYIMKHSVAAGAAASDDDTVRRSGLGESGRRIGLYVYRLAAAASGCSGARHFDGSSARRRRSWRLQEVVRVRAAI